MDSGNRKTIELSRLREITNNIFEHLESDLNVSSVDLEHDYYNSFTLIDMFEKEPDTAKSAMGQLYDDWGFLENLDASRTDLHVSALFEHVAALLNYVAFRYGE